MTGWLAGRGRALLRLFAVQGAWNYERMQGIGIGYAAAPLLEELARRDPARYPEAVARSAEFFNANPNLAGLAVGATVRAEYDGVPGAQIARLRTALCSPLGALGDRFFWVGLVPLVVGLALAAVALGGGLWAIVALLVAYNAVRVPTAAWALRTGLDSGMAVGRSLSASWLPRAAERIAGPASFAVGFGAALAAGWLLRPFGPGPALGALAVAAAGVALCRWLGAPFTALRFALLAIVLTLLLHRVTA